MTRHFAKPLVQSGRSASCTVNERLSAEIEHLRALERRQHIYMGALLMLALSFTIAGACVRFRLKNVTFQPDAMLQGAAEQIAQYRRENAARRLERSRFQLARPGNQGGYFYYNQQWIHVARDGTLDLLKFE